MRDTTPILDRKPLSKNKKLVARGGLHRIGAQSPYFTITHELFVDGRLDSFGCGHELIAQHFPYLTDLVDMHLSNIDGVPMHAEANGWYWLAGALGGAAEEYHGGNSKGHHGGEYREPTQDECLGIFASHCRISLHDAVKIRNLVERKCQTNEGRKVWKTLCNGMVERWGNEAKACIAKHNLQIFE